MSTQRGDALWATGRIEDAIKEYQNALQQNPFDVDAKIKLTQCYIAGKQLEKAEALANDVMADLPDEAVAHYLKAYVAFEKEQFRKSLEFLDRALAIDPENDGVWTLKGLAHLALKEHELALKAAESGLAVNSENAECLNVRMTALTKLGRKQEAFKGVLETLAQDPDNDYSHANAGWSYLENREYKKAKEHFAKALAKNPNSINAQEGMKQSIKATNPIYKAFLAYQFWINKQGKQMQWAFIIGIYVAFRIIRGLAADRPYLYPVVGLLVFLFLFSWFVTPLSNMLLFFNKSGKYLLDKFEKQGALLSAISLFGALVSLVLAFTLFADTPTPWYLLAGGLFLMVIPIGSMNNPDKPKSRRLLQLYTLGLALALFWGIISMVTGSENFIFMTIFFIGIFAYQWILNGVVIKEGNHS